MTPPDALELMNDDVTPEPALVATIDAPDVDSLGDFAPEPLPAAPIDTPPIRLNKDGTPAKKRGRKPGQTTIKAATTTAPVALPGASPAVLSTAAAMVALGTEGIALALGPEWRVTDAEEMGSLAGPLAVYLESVGVTEAPPLVVFVGAVIAYSVKRAEHENTRTKLAVAFVKARGFVSGLIDKLTGR